MTTDIILDATAATESVMMNVIGKITTETAGPEAHGGPGVPAVGRAMRGEVERGLDPPS